ncbi:amidase [Chloroflexus sp.]|uniref:amidase n=1 Tax=Chloroflexus sp. TaxID=1904827 RepID=UPI00261FFE2B|nr:amidase [uncultured Chloroflexus sp.]
MTDHDPTRHIGAMAYEATIAGLQADMESGNLTAEALTMACLERIEALNRAGPCLNAVIEVSPSALETAIALDTERDALGPRSPLHGIPVLLKDNIDTLDNTATTAGSLALLGSRPAAEATVAIRLRAAGAVILGKSNMSEWANFRSTASSSGWSARGGQARNPHVLTRSPCGSSSGSAIAVAASMCVVAIGTETDGSISCPSALCGVVGIKPTVGLTSRAGVIPISSTQDTVGPHARCVADAATVLGIIAGPDPRDPATAASVGHVRPDYRTCLQSDALRGARIGVLRSERFARFGRHVEQAFAAALQAMSEAGAHVVDPVSLPDELLAFSEAELTVLIYEFKATLNRYLAERIPDPQAATRAPRSLDELIAFNEQHAGIELRFFGQELFQQAVAVGGLDDEIYQQALQASRDAARRAIDQVLYEQQLDALVAPATGLAWPIDLIGGDHYPGGSSSLAARAGYPIVTVPAGMAFGLPVAINFIGSAWSEPMLIRLAYSFEQATRLRQPPAYRQRIVGDD